MPAAIEQRVMDAPRPSLDEQSISPPRDFHDTRTRITGFLSIDVISTLSLTFQRSFVRARLFLCLRLLFQSMLVLSKSTSLFNPLYLVYLLYVLSFSRSSRLFPDF